jgi:hypothetical protein
MNKRNNASKVRARLLTNHLSGEVWYCENYDHVKYIDGVEFITVCKQPGERSFLMAKNSLRPYTSNGNLLY